MTFSAVGCFCRSAYFLNQSLESWGRKVKSMIKRVGVGIISAVRTP
jgi:hypothetical protein